MGSSYVPDVNISIGEDMLSLLDMAYSNRREICIGMVGMPGIGKTQIVEQHAKAKGVKLVTIIASQILPNEVSGITMPVDGTHSMEIYDHARLSSLEDGDILFFDELLEADDSVLSACLTLIESRQMMSGKKLPDIQIIAATNGTRKSDSLKLSLRQRFLWVNAETSSKIVGEFIKEKYGKSFYALASFVELRDTGEFNVLTPRSIDKMIGMMLNAENTAQIDLVYSIARGAYGISFAQGLRGAVFKSTDLLQLYEMKEEALSKASSLEIIAVSKYFESVERTLESSSLPLRNALREELKTLLEDERVKVGAVLDRMRKEEDA